MALLLEATEATGVARGGIEPDDVLLMLSGIALVGDGARGPDQLSRMLDLLFAAVSVRLFLEVQDTADHAFTTSGGIAR